MDISVIGGGSLSFSETSCYGSGESFVKEKRIGTPKYDFAHIPTAGVDGTGSINYGFRTQEISFTMVFMGSSEELCLKSQHSASLVMASGPSNITFGGETFNRCFLDMFEAKITPKSTGLGGGLFYQEVDIKFTSRGL